MAILDDNWNYRIDSFKCESNKGFEIRSSRENEQFLQLNGFRVHKFDSKDISTNYDEELKILIEQNKQLRNEIDKKMEDLNKQKTKYETIKQDMKFLSQEIKDTHEAFLMAKKYYKKYLNMYYTVESKEGHKQTVFLQFFTEAKKESEKYSIRLCRDTKTEQYELLETIPKLNNTEEIKKKLHESKDMSGVLCDIRMAFLKIKDKKVMNFTTK